MAAHDAGGGAMIACPDCGSTHLGRRCGMTFLERLRTVQVSEANMETVERHNYFDAEGVREAFGEGSKEQLMDETKGLGFARRGPDGEFYRRDRHSGDVVRVSDA